MANDEFIDLHVSLKQCRQAVEALHSHELKKKEKFEETQILPGKEQHIWLNVTVKQVSASRKLKPVKIPIVHPLVDPRTSSVCLLTKDPQRQYKDLLETHNIKFISRVVGLEKLKGKFKAYEARRMLLKENSLFLADDRIIPLLPKLLGSKWFEAKKQPIPVCLTRKDLKGELERAISSTYMNQNRGTCTSIKIGKMSQTPSQILENLQTALPTVANAIKGGWDNIQNFAIKTNSSVSLPIWSCTLDETGGEEWKGLQAKDAEDEEVEVAKEKPESGKGRKRVSNSDEEVEEATKRRKTADSTSTTNVKVTSPLKTTKLTSDIVSSSKERKSTEIVTSSTKVVSTSKKGKPAKAPVTAEDVVSPDPEPRLKTLAGPEPTEATKGKKTKSYKPESSVSQAVKGADILRPDLGKFSISKEEMMQKRSTKFAGGKKKRIIIKSKGGKSAKNAVLGKRIGQE